MLKIYQEATEWNGVESRQPNHVYLISGDRAYGYSRWGKGTPEYFRDPYRLDRRGRRFVEVKNNPWGFDLTISTQQEEKPQGETWQVRGSKGDIYTVSLLEGRWSCTCPGSAFRGKCRHIAEVAQTAK